MSKQKSKTKQNNNKSKDIIPQDVVEDVIGDLTTNKDEKRRHKFALYWLLGLSIRKSALKAGYSKAYANGGIHSRMREGGFIRKEVEAILSKMPERYRQICQARLLTVSEIEGAALAEYRNDPKLAIDKPQLLRQVKTAAGALFDDPHQLPTIAIGTMNVVRNHLKGVIEDNSVDGKCEEISTEDDN